MEGGSEEEERGGEEREGGREDRRGGKGRGEERSGRQLPEDRIEKGAENSSVPGPGGRGLCQILESRESTAHTLVWTFDLQNMEKISQHLKPLCVILDHSPRSGNLVVAQSGFQGHPPRAARMRLRPASPRPHLPQEGEVEHPPYIFKMQKEAEMMGRSHGTVPGGRQDSNQEAVNKEDRQETG